MYLTINLDQFDIYNILSSEKTKNNVMNNSDFYRLYLSSPEFISNGIFLNFTLNNVSIDKYFNKIKCSFDNTLNNNTIQNISHIEKTILNKFNHINYSSCNRIQEQLNNNYIKIFDQTGINLGKYNKLNILLKISGIWSSIPQKEYGLTFRFFIVK
tara:strand:- start:96 stop:563 length:468 start_codon:yes stop_codon:yes gene_type:complete